MFATVEVVAEPDPVGLLCRHDAKIAAEATSCKLVHDHP